MIETVRKLEGEERISNIWAMYNATQGDFKNITDYTAAIRKVTNPVADIETFTKIVQNGSNT